MLGLPPHCWAHLVGVLDRKNIYLGSTVLIKIYPALSPTIRGQDGVDVSRCSWMRLGTFLIGKHQQVWFFWRRGGLNRFVLAHFLFALDAIGCVRKV